MRTTKVVPILASVIAAGLLVLATTSNGALAAVGNDNNGGTSAASVIAQLNKQTATCVSGTSTSLSCNQAAANTNLGNAVSVAQGGGNDDPPGGSTPSGTSAFSGIFQLNKQTATCIAGTSNGGSNGGYVGDSVSEAAGSCNQAATNTNLGNAVSAAFGSGP
jgi:hypothetical protein